MFHVWHATSLPLLFLHPSSLLLLPCQSHSQKHVLEELHVPHVLPTPYSPTVDHHPCVTVLSKTLLPCHAPWIRFLWLMSMPKSRTKHRIHLQGGLLNNKILLCNTLCWGKIWLTPWSGRWGVWFLKLAMQLWLQSSCINRILWLQNTVHLRIFTTWQRCVLSRALNPKHWMPT
jgi:hypothetical protein